MKVQLKYHFASKSCDWDERVYFKSAGGGWKCGLCRVVLICKALFLYEMWFWYFQSFKRNFALRYRFIRKVIAEVDKSNNGIVSQRKREWLQKITNNHTRAQLTHCLVTFSPLSLSFLWVYGIYIFLSGFEATSSNLTRNKTSRRQQELKASKDGSCWQWNDSVTLVFLFVCSTTDQM